VVLFLGVGIGGATEKRPDYAVNATLIGSWKILLFEIIFAVVMGEKGCKIHVGCIFNCCRGCGRYMEKLLKMNTLYRWDVGTVVATLTVTVNFPIVGWLVCLVLLML
jgi:hypothetical protein